MIANADPDISNNLVNLEVFMSPSIDTPDKSNCADELYYFADKPVNTLTLPYSGSAAFRNISGIAW